MQKRRNAAVIKVKSVAEVAIFLIQFRMNYIFILKLQRALESGKMCFFETIDRDQFSFYKLANVRAHRYQCYNMKKNTANMHIAHTE